MSTSTNTTIKITNPVHQNSIRLYLFALLIVFQKTSLDDIKSRLPRSRVACTTDFDNTVRSAIELDRWNYFDGDLKGSYYFDPTLYDALRNQFKKIFMQKGLFINRMDSEEDFMEIFSDDSDDYDPVILEGWEVIELAALILNI